VDLRFSEIQEKIKQKNENNKPKHKFQKTQQNKFKLRCKILKQQEQLQNEMIDEIKVKSETLLKSKQELYQKYVTLVDRQGDLQAKYVLE
jgi:hypothetical protein